MLDTNKFLGIRICANCTNNMWWVASWCVFPHILRTLQTKLHNMKPAHFPPIGMTLTRAENNDLQAAASRFCCVPLYILLLGSPAGLILCIWIIQVYTAQRLKILACKSLHSLIDRIQWLADNMIDYSAVARFEVGFDFYVIKVKAGTDFPGQACGKCTDSPAQIHWAPWVHMVGAASIVRVTEASTTTRSTPSMMTASQQFPICFISVCQGTVPWAKVLNRCKILPLFDASAVAPAIITSTACL